MGRPAGRLRTARGRPPRDWSRSSEPARSLRSRSAGCWSGGGAERRRPRRRERARQRCAVPPSARRRRCPAWSDPLGRYLLELEADQAEGRSWYGEPGRAELVEWQPVLSRAGVRASPVSGRAGLSRAGRARPCARGPGDRGAHAVGSEPVRPLGGPLRPAREPPQRRPRGSESPGRLSHVRCLAPDTSESNGGGLRRNASNRCPWRGDAPPSACSSLARPRA